MVRLSRKLRVCKLVGTVGCVLIVAAFVGGGWWVLGFAWRAGPDTFAVVLDDGCIGFARVAWNPKDALGWTLIQHSSAGWKRFHSPWIPLIGRDSPRHYATYLSLWLPFLALFIPTLLLWRRDRRKPRPGFCRRCDYDLTGNTSGRCPECGTAITP